MKLWIPLILAVFVVAAAPVAEKTVWKAGAASAKITPEKSMWMAGYAARTKPSEGVELDLFAKALVLTDQAGAKFALVTMDLIGVPREVRLTVAARVKTDFGIDGANLAINASHTHSGPELRATKLFGSDDVVLREKEAADYTAKLEDTIVRLIGEAIQTSLLEEQKSHHAGRVLQRMDAEGPLSATYPYPVQVLRLGTDLTWVTLGGEVVVDYSLRLKRDIQDGIDERFACAREPHVTLVKTQQPLITQRVQHAA
jgi:hypothetical protein